MKKTNSGIMGYAFSLIIDQLIAILVSLVATNIINFFAPSGSLLLNFIVCISVYFIISYSDSWSRGCSDRNRIRLGVIADNKMRGFLCGLIAAIPGLILAFFAFLAETGTASFRDVLGADIFTTLNRLWHLPLGVLFRYVNEFPLLNFVYPMFLPIISGIGYILGLNEIRLKQIFVYRSIDDEVEE